MIPAVRASWCVVGGGLFALHCVFAYASTAGAQERAAPPAAAPLRLSARCTCPDPSDFRTTSLYSPTAINDAEHIAGTTRPGAGQPVHAALATPGGALIDLLASDVRSARAADINEAGVVVGEVEIVRASGSVVRTPFRYTPGSGLEELPSPIAAPLPTVVALNEAGDILVSQANRGFVWSAATGTYDELPGLGRAVMVTGLNDAGDVVGALTDAAGMRSAVLWSGRPYALTALLTPPHVDGRRWSRAEASAINTRGTIVGSACGSDGCVPAAWLGPTHAFRVLGSRGYPTAVNAHDLASGSPSSPSFHALLLWDVASGEELNLPMPTPYMHVAVALNDAGTAVGFRYDFEPDRRGAVRFPRVVCED